MLKNYMEDIVANLLPETLDNYDGICRCSQCINDIKAIALNNLKPLYFTSEKGEIYNRLNEFETQFGADVLKELINAIEKVSKNPDHK